MATEVQRHATLLATIESLNNGSPYKTILAETIPEVVSVFRYYGGWADKLHGQTMNLGPAKFAYTIQEPIGVCAQIIPWNYPLMMAAWKLAPALCCGNTVILKTSEEAPLSVLFLADLFRNVGFPPGVVNIVNGTGHVAGAALVRHQSVDKVAFTGSTAVAREISSMSGQSLKSVTLEAGGKSPLIVFADADLELAAAWAHAGIFSNQGQICTGTSRILVHPQVYDDFLIFLRDRVEKISVLGDPFDDATFQGPMITYTQFRKVVMAIKQAQKQGATIYYGAGLVDDSTCSRSKRILLNENDKHGEQWFVEPTILTNVRQSDAIWQEETFGPVVCISKIKPVKENPETSTIENTISKYHAKDGPDDAYTESQEETTALDFERGAMRMANDSLYGLGAAIFTRDMARAHRMARGIESGTIWINSSNDTDFRVPFGGFKQSGAGYELGEKGLDAYLRTKSIHVNLKDRY